MPRYKKPWTHGCLIPIVVLIAALIIWFSCGNSPNGSGLGNGAERVQNLVGEWNFGIHTEGDGGNWINQIDAGRNDGVLTVGTEDLEWSLYGWGNDLDGTDDYIEYGDLTNVPGWNDNSWSMGGIVIAQAGNGDWTNWFGISDNNWATCNQSCESVYVGDHSGALRISSNGDTPGTTGSSLTAGETYHVILTVDGTTARAYLNGVLDYSSTFSGSGWQNATVLISGRSQVGASGDNFCNAVIVNIRLWNVVLTSSEVWNDYQSYRAN